MFAKLKAQKFKNNKHYQLKLHKTKVINRV